MFRSLVTASSRTPTLRTSRVSALRAFSASATSRLDTNENKSQTDQTSDDKHAVNKASDGEANDVQSSNAKAGMNADKNGGGGSATEGRDSAGGKEKAKKEFPEAPDTIGMQDERGGRGA